MTSLRTIARHPVARNAAALWWVQLATFLLPLIVVPYLSRVLGPGPWGLVFFAQSFAAWLTLVIEYGFNLSATRELARCREDNGRVSALVSGVHGAKAGLLLLSIVAALAAALAVPLFREHPGILIGAWMLCAVQGFSPMWYFQGCERMGLPALLTVVARALSTVLILILVKSPDHAALVLYIQAGSLFVAHALCLWVLYREVAWALPTFPGIMATMRTGWSMFLFRSSVALYTTANAFVLGLLAPPPVVAFFASAERVSKSLLQMLSPVSQALYPRINSLIDGERDKAKKIVRLSLAFMAAGGVILGGLIAVFAPWIVRIVLGPGYEPVVPVLRILSLLMPLISVSNVLGIQWMLPNRMDKPFNRIIIAAGAINIVLAVLLAMRWGAIGMATAVVVTELFVTLAMVLVVIKSGKRQAASG
jgi:polysaccharide transporter, PST family